TSARHRASRTRREKRPVRRARRWRRSCLLVRRKHTTIKTRAKICGRRWLLLRNSGSRRSRSASMRGKRRRSSSSSSSTRARAKCKRQSS
ncbi:hypothetical protein KEM55_005865, partial [Ascosphaera atra]